MDSHLLANTNTTIFDFRIFQKIQIGIYNWVYKKNHNTNTNINIGTDVCT